MKKQTAVMKFALSFRGWQRDWDRYDKEKINKPKSFDEFIEPFLELEKQQIIDAHADGNENFTMPDDNYLPIAEQYYFDTYGSKGSDEHIVDTNKMVEKSGKPINLTSSQTEISDEEIDMAALHNEPRVTRRAFRSGAKWAINKLKNK